MNVSSRLAIANLASVLQRRAEREDIAAATSPGESVIRGKLISSSRDGYTLQTQSGGTITIPRRTTDAQNFSPTKGAVYQASISAGNARIQASSRSKATEAQRQVVKQFIVAAGPPTIDDKGARLTLHFGLTLARKILLAGYSSLICISGQVRLMATPKFQAMGR